MAGKTKILAVDDDKHIAELISLYLEKEGYEVKEVYDGKGALEEFFAFSPALVLLDMMLPGVDGITVLKEIRQKSKTPVIMLTAKGDTFDKVLALELGADDYIVKPFDPKELIARIKAVLRRFESCMEAKAEKKTITFDNLEINLADYTVKYHGKQISFPLKEFELLQYLANRPNQVFTREQLLDKIWGYEYIGDTRTVDVHIKRIREKLNQADPWQVATVWGIGYKFEVSK